MAELKDLVNNAEHYKKTRNERKTRKRILDQPINQYSQSYVAITPGGAENTSDVSIPAFDDQGSFLWCSSPDGTQTKHYVLTPATKVIARTTDSSGGTHGLLIEFADPRTGRNRQATLPLEIAGGEYPPLRAWLLNRGLTPIICEGIRAKLPLWFQQQAQRCKRWITLVRQTGWNDDCFVMPGHTIGETHALLADDESCASMESKGTLDDWKQTVATTARGNSRLVFAISAAFAGPLLLLSGLTSGGFHFRGSSSIGKTILLRAAASVWGSDKFLRTWRSTSNGVEAMAAAHCDLPLLLDEIGQISPHDLAEVLYAISQGTGKQRANKLGGAQPRLAWRVLLLSTGELSAADALLSVGRRFFAGQDVRFIDIPADAGRDCGVFDITHDFKPAAFAERIEAQIHQFYGSAGPAFVSRLVPDRERAKQWIDDAASQFKAIYAEYCKNGQANRAASRFALVAAAGELATHYGVTGWDEGEALSGACVLFEQWLESRGAGGPLEERQVIEQVRNFFELHGEARFVRLTHAGAREERVIQNRAGFRRESEDGIVEFWVAPGVFTKEVAKGFDARFVCDLLWRKAFLVRKTDSSENTQLRHAPGEGTQRFYVLSGRLLE